MGVNQMDLYYVSCDWWGCPVMLENLPESEIRSTLMSDGWEIDGDVSYGAYTYCPDHDWTDG